MFGTIDPKPAMLHSLRIEIARLHFAAEALTSAREALIKAGGVNELADTLSAHRDKILRRARLRAEKLEWAERTGVI